MEPDRKRNQAGQDQSDDPSQSSESGAPEIEGLLRGRQEEEQTDKLAGEEEPPRKPGGDQDWESGRYQAT